MDPKARLTSLIQGALAGNIFDWGARATVDLYHDGTILEIYRSALLGLYQMLQSFALFQAPFWGWGPCTVVVVMMAASGRYRPFISSGFQEATLFSLSPSSQ